MKKKTGFMKRTLIGFICKECKKNIVHFYQGDKQHLFYCPKCGKYWRMDARGL